MKRNGVFLALLRITTSSHFTLFSFIRAPSPLPPRKQKIITFFYNPLPKEIYSEDPLFPGLPIDNAQQRATVASIVFVWPISPAFAPVPPCIF